MPIEDLNLEMNLRDSAKLSSLPSNMEETKVGYAVEFQEQKSEISDSDVLFIGERRIEEFDYSP